MASGTIDKSPFYSHTDTYTINGGYVVIVNNRIKTTSNVVVQILRDDNSVWSGYSCYPRISENGSMYVFFRNSEGDFPVEGSTVKLSMIIS